MPDPPGVDDVHAWVQHLAALEPLHLGRPGRGVDDAHELHIDDRN